MFSPSSHRMWHLATGRNFSTSHEGLHFLQRFKNGQILIVGEVDFSRWSFYKEIRSCTDFNDTKIISTRLANSEGEIDPKKGITSSNEINEENETISGIDARFIDAYNFSPKDCIISTFLRVPDGKDYQEKNKALIDSFVSTARFILRPGGSIFLALLSHQKGQFQIKDLAKRMRLQYSEHPFIWKTFKCYRPRDTEGNLWSPTHNALMVELRKKALKRRPQVKKIRIIKQKKYTRGIKLKCFGY